MRGDEKLWDVVSKASKSIKTLKANKSGLAFWNMIEKEEWTPPYTVSYQSLLQPETSPASIDSSLCDLMSCDGYHCEP